LLETTEAGSSLELFGARYVDFTSGGLSQPVSIRIRDQRIKSIHTLNETIAEPVDSRLDLAGMYMCPALIDMHVHLCHEPRAHRDVTFSHREPDYLSAYRVVQNLSEALLHGVCLVRDVGGRDIPLQSVSKDIRGGALTLPEIEMAGVPLCIAGGHGHEFGQTIDGSDFRQLVGKHVGNGHSWIKVMNGPELWDVDELRRLCDVAHEHGLKVAVHAFSDDGVWPAVLAHADTVEHCLASSEQLAAVAMESGTQFVPTAFAARTSLAISFAARLSRREQMYLEEWLAYLTHSVAVHLRMGLPVLAGTDAGCAPCQAQDIIDELLQLESWGFGPLQILEGATRHAARVLGREGDFGEIAVGHYANMIVTNKNPLERLGALSEPVLILSKGVPVVDRVGANLA